MVSLFPAPEVSRRLPNPLADLLADERGRIVGLEALQLLPTVQRRVLTLRYGLDGDGERTLHEIGLVIGKSKERARQLEAEGLLLLAGMLEGLL
jgi:DNA-directed RNA polymerase sigma subunit (sigma70/sigma32)